jgi:hypothetical protein
VDISSKEKIWNGRWVRRVPKEMAAVQGDDQGAVNTVQAVVCRQAREKLEAMGVKMTD